MEINVGIIIDGNIVKINDELQTLLESLTSNYIKQKFIMGKTVKAEKVPRGKGRKFFSKVDLENIFNRAKGLQHLTKRQASLLVSKEFQHPVSTIYNWIWKWEKAGELKFAKAEYPQNYAKRIQNQSIPKPDVDESKIISEVQPI